MNLYLFYRVDEDEEIIVKAMTDYWVVGKKSDQRELYVILNQKNANLIEVNGMFPPPVISTTIQFPIPLHFSNPFYVFLLLFLFCRGGKEALCNTVQQHFLLGLIKRSHEDTKKKSSTAGYTDNISEMQ